MDKRKIIKGDRGNFYWINIYINRKNIDGILLKYFLSILKKHPSYMLMDIEIKKNDKDLFLIRDHRVLFTFKWTKK